MRGWVRGEGVLLVVSECVFLSAFFCILQFSQDYSRNVKVSQKDRVGYFYIRLVSFLTRISFFLCFNPFCYILQIILIVITGLYDLKIMSQYVLAILQYTIYLDILKTSQKEFINISIFDQILEYNDHQ